jgi:3',5'-cyclic-AMP phosphodiesterase
MPIYLPPLSRRQFLAGALAAGASLPQWSFGLEPDSLEASKSQRYLLMSDMHIGSYRAEKQHGVKTAELFHDAVKQILASKDRHDKAIVTGDCALAHGSHAEYKLFHELLSPLRKANMSFHFAVGNHDERGRFLAAFPGAKKLADPHAKTIGKYVYIMKTPLANWFFLDSLHKTNTSPGRMGHDQLKWLAKSLDAYPHKPALVLAHHDPSLQSHHALEDTEAFYKVISPRIQVKAYIFGHTHCWSVRKYQGIHLVNIPTIAAWKADSEPRGFLTALLHKNGMSLTLHAIDHKHAKHGEKHELKWRSA